VRARAAGAAGFIAKTNLPETIIGMVEIVLQGGVAFGACARPGTIPVITPRQAEVLALLAEGHANKEIRHRLGIAERTVRAHLTELFHLLGANSRMQAVIRGREFGLIE
jgi:DNA-binding NarL/FixJ family response regulator